MKHDTTATTRTRPTHASARSFMRRHGFGPYVVDWHRRTIKQAVESLGWRVATIDRDPEHGLWNVNAYVPSPLSESSRELRKLVREALKERRIAVFEDTLDVCAWGKKIVVALISDRDRPQPQDVDLMLQEGNPVHG
ncbi:MAG: hypothetical protein ACI82F_002680 [Planctomycetota bacterium]|jgi:hypothetical protein